MPYSSSTIESPSPIQSPMPRTGFTVHILEPGGYGSWDDLVTQSPHGTIFQYSWWLQATGYDFEILVCRDDRGRVIAGIPLPRKKKAGLKLFHSPQLTPYLGPVFDLSGVKRDFEKLALMRRLGEILARAIRGYDSLIYGIGANGPDLQGFLWSGFRAELAYTFRFEAGTILEAIYEGMAPKHRHELAKAERHSLTVEVGDDIDAMLKLIGQTFARQGKVPHFEESLARRLWVAARAHNQANVYLARSPKGSFATGVLTVHDRRTSYQLLAGGDPNLRSLGGGNLAEYRAIQDAVQAGRAYDFEGSALRGVEGHYRHWGARAKPTWRLIKAGNLRGALGQMFIARQMNRHATAFRSSENGWRRNH